MDFNAIAHGGALLIGSVTLLIGVFAMLKPVSMSKKFGVVTTAGSEAYVISTGARDVFIGFTVIVLFFYGEWRALGLINLCLGFVAGSDFIVVRTYGERKTALTHLAGAVAVITYGAWLLL